MMEIDQFCQSLPKVELHAHLNGSITQETILEILKRSGDSRDPSAFAVRDGMSYVEAFQVFGAIHSLVTDIETIQLITDNVIEEFRADNVRYLELRTTPKSVPGTSITKECYLRCVLDVIKHKSASPGILLEERNCISNPIIVRLLVSIDRGRSAEDAKDTLNLVNNLMKDAQYSDFIVGIDFSGNPHAKGLENYLPLLREAKDNGMYLSVHVGETPNTEENLDLLKLLPDRIGHAVFIHPSEGGTKEMVDIIANKKIPIEICLTSNLFCGIVEKIEDHHFKFWRDDKHPLIICTDDKGIFNTSVSEEYHKAAKAFRLSKKDLAQLSLNAIDSIAEDETVKRCLKDRWKMEYDKLDI